MIKRIYAAILLTIIHQAIAQPIAVKTTKNPCGEEGLVTIESEELKSVVIDRYLSEGTLPNPFELSCSKKNLYTLLELKANHSINAERLHLNDILDIMSICTQLVIQLPENALQELYLCAARKLYGKLLPEQAIFSDFIANTNAQTNGILSSLIHKEARMRAWHMTAIEHQDIPICSIDCSPNGTTVAIAYTNGTVSLWNTQTRTLLKTKKICAAETQKILSLRFITDGRLLATVTSSDDNRVAIIDVMGQSLTKLTEPHTEEVILAEISVDGKRFITATQRALYGWNTTKHDAEAPTATLNEFNIKTAHIHTDLDAVIVVTDSEELYLWNAYRGTTEKVYISCSNATFSGDGNTIIVTNTHNTMEFYSVYHPQINNLTFAIADYQADSAAVCSCSEPIAINSAAGLTLLNKPAEDMPGQTLYDTRASFIKFCQNANILLVITPDNSIHIWTPKYDIPNADLLNISQKFLVLKLLSRNYRAHNIKHQAEFTQLFSTLPCETQLILLMKPKMK